MSLAAGQLVAWREGHHVRLLEEIPARYGQLFWAEPEHGGKRFVVRVKDLRELSAPPPSELSSRG